MQADETQLADVSGDTRPRATPVVDEFRKFGHECPEFPADVTFEGCCEEIVGRSLPLFAAILF